MTEKNKEFNHYSGLPINEQILQIHTKDLLLYFNYMLGAEITAKFAEEGIETTVRKHPGTRTALGLKLGKRTLEKYLDTYVTLTYTGYTIFMDCSVFKEIRTTLLRKYTYAEANQCFRLLCFMMLQCFQFRPLSIGTKRLPAAAGMSKTTVVQWLPIIIANNWIVRIMRGYVNPDTGEVKASLYINNSKMVPTELTKLYAYQHMAVNYPLSFNATLQENIDLSEDTNYNI